MAATTSTSSRPLPKLAKYDVLEELGHGGMATVYRAHDRRLSRDVAVKVIHPHLRDSKEVKARFFVEAQAVAKLRHPNIVEVYDLSSESEAEQYLVVELLRGVTLRKLLADRGAMPPEVAGALALELLAAIGHAHACGVVHRDVKPENVILEHRPATGTPRPPAAAEVTGDSGRPPAANEAPGERVQVKLTDFGIAKLLDAQGVTSTGQVLGSPAHMAPEQIEGGDVDARADVFGLGVLLYECMVGHLPFQGNNPAQVLRRVLDGIYPPAERERAEVGRRWSGLLDRALARRVEDRWSSAGEVRDAIVDELKRLGVEAPRRELETWLDDPEAYVVAAKARLIEKLCALGAQARRAGDAITAAADYNRALAYAPDDAELLKLVGSMHRAEGRARLARRLAPAVAGALALGVVSFFVARALRDRPPPRVEPIPLATPAARQEPPPPQAPSAAPPASRATAALPPPQARLAARPNLAAPPPVAIHRTVRVSTLFPLYGVIVALDREAPTEASSGQAFAVNEKAHTLTFSCKEELCVPQTKSVAAGETDEALEVDLKIKPASLTIAGDPSKSYVIRELPTLSPQAGVAVAVPMSRKNETVHVKELLSGREVAVTLTAGQPARASFGDEP